MSISTFDGAPVRPATVNITSLGVAGLLSGIAPRFVPVNDVVPPPGTHGVGVGVGGTGVGVGVGGTGVGVGVGVGGTGVGVGVGQPVPAGVSLSVAADTDPVSAAALSVNVSVHTPFGSATPANAADMLVTGEKLVAACGPAAVVR